MSTLYSNENPQLWNPETDEYDKVKLVEEENEVLKVIEEGHTLELLKNSSGFKLIETYLLATIEDLKNKLATETDFKKIRRLQEAAKAYSNVLLFMDYKIHEGRALAQQRTPEGANPKE